MRSEGGRTKGVGFVNVKAFVTERFGAHGWEAVLARLDPEDREELTSMVSVGWYSLPLYARLIHALDEVHGYADLSLVVQLGRFEAERDLTTIHRVFLRFFNPAFMVEKFAEYWKRFHDTGEWVATRDSDHQITATLTDWACVDHALCRELVGYFTRTLELVGAKNLVIEHPKCRARGDAQCVFRARWGSFAADAPSREPSSPGASGPRPALDSSGEISARVRARDRE